MVYTELENHFEDQLRIDHQVGSELDELEKLVAENMIEEDSKVEDIAVVDPSSTSSSPSKEPPDKRPKIVKMDKENLEPETLSCAGSSTQITRCTSPDLFADSDEETTVPAVSNKSQDCKEFSDRDLNNLSAKQCLIAEPTSMSTEPLDVQDFSIKVYKNVSVSEPLPSVEELEEASQITTYEIFSSSSDEGEKH